MSLLNQILQLKKEKVQFFTTPSHSQGAFNLPYLKDLYKFDFSEMDGLDNLREPKEVLAQMLEQLTTVYKTKKTFALINGSSSGNVASMLTVLKDHDKVLVADNCHVSVKNGLVLTRAEADFFAVEKDEKFGCPVSINREKLFEKIEQGNYKAIILTSPTYEGVDLKIKDIIDFSHSKNVIVIVDEAHGALFPFSEKLPKSAIELGADFVVQSLHKTAGAVNPAALLHIGKNSEINLDDVQKSLNLINTTSPSYPLLLSIEGCVNYLNENRNAVDKLVKNIEDFKKFMKNKVEILPSYQIVFKIKNMDMLEFADKLYKKFKIECEISDKNYALFYCGLGTSKKKIDYLKRCVEKTSQKGKL